MQIMPLHVRSAPKTLMVTIISSLLMVGHLCQPFQQVTQGTSGFFNYGSYGFFIFRTFQHLEHLEHLYTCLKRLANAHYARVNTACEIYPSSLQANKSALLNSTVYLLAT